MVSFLVFYLKYSKSEFDLTDNFVRYGQRTELSEDGCF